MNPEIYWNFLVSPRLKKISPSGAMKSNSKKPVSRNGKPKFCKLFTGRTGENKESFFSPEP
jgi:hypothetical protein